MMASVIATRIIALLLGLVWLPASSHCLLEAAEWLASDHGCEAASHRSEGHSSHDECASCQFETNSMFAFKAKNSFKTHLAGPMPFCRPQALEWRCAPPLFSPPHTGSPPPHHLALGDLGLLLASPPRAPGRPV